MMFNLKQAPTPPSCHSNNQRGFTLIELSIVLTIAGLIAVASFTMGEKAIEVSRWSQTNQKLDSIEAALKSFRDAYGRLPCPADVSLLESNASFGAETATPGTCTGVNFTDAATNVIEGGIPFQVLKLPKEFAYDGWGRRIAYGVWKNFTASNGVNTALYSDANCGKIIVTDGLGNYTTKGAYVLLSYGADGHGAYNKQGQRSATTQSINRYTLVNAHYSLAGTATIYSANYALKNPSYVSFTNQFDDLLRNKMRWQLQNWEDGTNTTGLPCP